MVVYLPDSRAQLGAPADVHAFGAHAAELGRWAPKMRKLLASIVALASVTSRVTMAQPATDPDVQVIEQMQKNGSNLKKPHPIDFYLYFPTEEKARSSASILERDHFHITRVERSPKANAWVVIAQKTLVPVANDVIAISKKLEAVASAHGGEYDGWDAPIIK